MQAASNQQAFYTNIVHMQSQHPASSQHSTMPTLTSCTDWAEQIVRTAYLYNKQHKVESLAAAGGLNIFALHPSLLYFHHDHMAKA